MKAIVQTEFGGPEVLHFAEMPTPTLRPQDILVRVHATSINPTDYKRRGGGKGALPQPVILGWDAAGVVQAVGESATRFKVGDQVYFAGDATRQGSYAELVAVDERIVGHKPKRLSFVQAAAIPLTALTACEAFFEQMHIPATPTTPTRTVLIIGGAGGVGSIATQIAKRVLGLKVVATASRRESIDFCKRMGADVVIDHSQPLAPQMEAQGLTTDYILNCNDLKDFAQLVTVLNTLGVICTIAGGPALHALDVTGLFAKRGTFTAELMFVRPRTNVEPEKQGAILDQVAEWLDAGTIESTLSKVLPWSDVQAAHRELEGGHVLGKIVLEITT